MKESKPNRVGIWVYQIVFLSAKVQTSKNLPMWGKCLPFPTRLRSLPPLSVLATALPLNVFTLSSFDCGRAALFCFNRESWIHSLSSSQTELNTAPHGRKECVTGTIKSQKFKKIVLGAAITVEICKSKEGSKTVKHHSLGSVNLNQTETEWGQIQV